MKKSRTAILAVLGFGFISAAAWTVWMPAGLLFVGGSFLALEYLSKDGKS
jgi:hypothetical protein